jgi:curli production assembly/transport component CsgG
MDSTMMKKTILAIAVTAVLTGCGTVGNALRVTPEPEIITPRLKSEPKLQEPMGGPIAVAVYNFRDMTGQRKSSQTIATLSSAVTQGADAYLVKSLQEVGDSRWFKVLERGGLDNLVKERQLIRQMRELYQGKDAEPLPPMLFAGMLIEGGIIGYDSNIMSGGSGARILGIGATTEYRQDEVTISLRAVSVATGEVLVTVNTTKRVISFQDKMGVLKFYDAGTQSLELETGSATNESMNKAVQLAIHAGVIEMIRQGLNKGHWQAKPERVTVVAPPAPVPVIEEKKDELVQPNTTQKNSTETAPASQQSNVSSIDSRPIEPSGQAKSAEAEKPQADVRVPETQTRSGTVRDWANIRAERGIRGEKLAKLAPGDQVEIIRSEDYFYFVRSHGVEGWVHMKLIKAE